MSLKKTAAERRKKLAQKIENGLVILQANPIATRYRDNLYHPYHPNPYLYYFTACTQPQTALLLVIEQGRLQSEIFFCPPSDPQREKWEGASLTPQTATKHLNISQAQSIHCFNTVLNQHLCPKRPLYCLLADPHFKSTLVNVIQDKPQRATKIIDLATIVDEMRLIKDEFEIASIREACTISAQAIKSAMRQSSNAKYEYEVDATLIKCYREQNAHHAFAPIVASGKNACTLHYTQNSAPIEKKSLLLIDSGGLKAGYSGDITRSFPINGKWKSAATDLYEIVLAAQEKAIAAAVPNSNFEKIEKIATEELIAGLRYLKLSKRGLKKDYLRFYMHKIGHWLGLDVHDVGGIKDASGKPRSFVPGMVLTIEPGLYIPTTKDIPPELRGIGIRIEDDLLITSEGNQVLTATVPKTRKEISQWIQEKP